jgi:hypothetical protein
MAVDVKATVAKVNANPAFAFLQEKDRHFPQPHTARNLRAWDNWQSLKGEDGKPLSDEDREEIQNRVTVIYEKTSSFRREIGKELLEIKRLVEHGSFQKLVEFCFGYQPRTAERYMLLASGLTDAEYAIISKLGLTVACEYEIAGLVDYPSARVILMQMLAEGKKITVTQVRKLYPNKKELPKPLTAKQRREKAVKEMQQQVDGAVAKALAEAEKDKERAVREAIAVAREREIAPNEIVARVTPQPAIAAEIKRDFITTGRIADVSPTVDEEDPGEETADEEDPIDQVIARMWKYFDDGIYQFDEDDYVLRDYTRFREYYAALESRYEIVWGWLVEANAALEAETPLDVKELIAKTKKILTRPSILTGASARTAPVGAEGVSAQGAEAVPEGEEVAETAD